MIFDSLNDSMKTFSAKVADVQRHWWIIDATDRHLGHVAVQAANLLRGKGKPIYTPHVDTGDFVIVINADKVRVAARRMFRNLHEFFRLCGRVTISPKTLPRAGNGIPSSSWNGLSAG